MRIYTGTNLELQNLVKNKFIELGYHISTPPNKSTIGFIVSSKSSKEIIPYDKNSTVDENQGLYPPHISIPEFLDMKPKRTLKDVRVGEEFNLTINPISTFKMLSNVHVKNLNYVYYDIIDYELHYSFEEKEVV